MNSEELIARYKILPLYVRLCLTTLLSLYPAYEIYSTDGENLEYDLADVEVQYNKTKLKYEKERKKRAKIPELETKLAFTEQQLKESSKRLPDSFAINDVLQQAATIANDVGVNLQVFDPGEAKPGKGTFKYMELTIDLELQGKFQQILSFFDQVVNMEKMVFISDISLKPFVLKPENKSNTTKVNSDVAQRRKRSLQRIRASSVMKIYRMMTQEEIDRLPKENVKIKTSSLPVKAVDVAKAKVKKSIRSM